MKKTILLTLVLCSFLFSLSLVSAATDTIVVDDIFKMNDRINYAKPCFSNGTYCSVIATCNFSVFKPDNSIIINNQLGTNQGAFHNISFIVSDIGIHKVDMTCVDGILVGAATFYFEVTGSGLNDTIWFYVIILVISFGIIIMGFNLEDAPMVILGSFGLYFVGIYILFNGIVGVKDPVTTWAIGIIVLALAGYISIRSAYELIEG